MSSGDALVINTPFGSPDTMSLGRPVEPPEVGAFHAGEITSGSGSAFGLTTGATNPRRPWPRPGKASASAPSTTRGSANSMMAASSRTGSREDTGWGIAPDLPGGRHGDNPVDRVGQGNRDHVPDVDAIVDQLPGQGVGGCLEFCLRHRGSVLHT